MRDGNRWVRLVIGICGFYSILIAPSFSDAVYPLKVSANGRYLVDQNNAPFMMIGDSPQATIGKLSPIEADWYFTNRQARGFNAVWINLLCNKSTGCNADGTTFDGIAPFTKIGDIATPNEAYFARADEIIRLAANHGLLVILDPIETAGWLTTLRHNGREKAFNYGVYLGNRYQNFPNIIWMSGNDFQDWHLRKAGELTRAVARGIQSVDMNHIHTVELDYPTSSSLNDKNWASIISLNAAYTYNPTYAEVLNAYNQSTSKPVFMVEANYEFENNNGTDTGTPNVLRRQEYWSVLSGATAQLYGNKFSWQFIAGWQSNLDTAGVEQLGYLTKLLAGYRWYDLVPDQDHSVVTDGYGRFSSNGTVGGSDYVTAARTPDGKLVMAYLPTVRRITVDMTKLAEPTTAHWFDPTNGTFTSIPGSPFANSEKREFTPPGKNHDGDDDWVLVLEQLSSSRH